MGLRNTVDGSGSLAGGLIAGLGAAIAIGAMEWLAVSSDYRWP